MELRSQNNTLLLTKSILIILFLLFSISVLFLSQFCSAGYKLSIYDNLPFSALMLLILIISSGILITLKCYRAGSDLWELGLLLVILSNLIFLFLPLITGYAYSANGDHLTHIGFTKDIIQTSHINSYMDRNVYPVTHLIVAEISLVTEIPVNVLVFFIGPFFYILFLCYTYVLSRKLTPDSKVFATLASTVLFCYFFKEIFPMGFAFLTFPLVFYIYYNYREKKNIGYAIILLLLILIMPFFHPIAGIILTLILLIFEITSKFIDIIFLRANKYKLSLTLALFSLIIVIVSLWQISWLWSTSVLNVVKFLNLDLMNTPALTIANNSFNKLGLKMYQILEIFLKSYGSVFLFSILALISALKVIFNKDFSSKKKRFMFVLSFVLIICSIVWLIDYVRPLMQVSSGRIMWLVIPIFPLFVGISLHKIYKWNFIKKESIKFLIIFFIMASGSFISLFALYPSPQIFQFNTAVSFSEMDGMNWIISNSSDEIQILEISYVLVNRYENALNGTLKTKINREDKKGVGNHFNYINYDKLGEMYKEDKYLILRPNFILSLNEYIYKNLDKFNKDDFRKLDEDSSTSKIYENGEMDIRFINSSKN